MAVWLGEKLWSGKLLLPRYQRMQGFIGSRLQEQAPVAFRDGQGPVHHRGQDILDGHTRLEQGCGFQQQAQLAKVARARFQGRGLVESREKLRNRIVRPAGMKDQLDGVDRAEGNRIGVAQQPGFHLFPVDEDAVSLAPVFQATSGFGVDQRGRAA